MPKQMSIKDNKERKWDWLYVHACVTHHIAPEDTKKLAEMFLSN